MTLKHKLLTFAAASLLATSFSTTAFAEVNLKKDMSKEQQEKAGLNKLSKEELLYLNQWLSNKDQQATKNNTLTVTKENFGLSKEELIKETTDKITATIKEVSKKKRGRYLLTLANDQVWATMESKRLLLREGDQVEIRKGALDSYVLISKQRGVRVKVRRES